MKAFIYYIHVELSAADILLDKIDELGYKATHVMRNNTLQVYRVEMDIEDLTILMLTVPLLEIDILEE